MARSRGSYNFSQNFEVFRTAPLDARQKVQLYTDLVDPAAWEDSQGYVWLYKGAIVVVTEDPSSGLYWLTDAANYDQYDSWRRIVSSISGEGADGINIGDGSAGVYAGNDASGNLQFRTFEGSGAATVTEVGDQIVIGIDASFSGEVNFGENIGAGDASIYKQKVGDALEFRTLKAGNNITLDVSGNTIIINSSGGGGDSIAGGVWISDITPSGSGNVGDKVYVSSGEVLESCLTDTTGLSVSVIAVPGHNTYEPSVSIYGTPVTNFSLNNPGPQWTGSANITFNSSDTSIGAIHDEGAFWYTEVSQDTPAVISSADFVNGYPGSQTELKAGDTYDVRVQTDVAITQVIVDNFGAATGGTYNVSGNDVTFTITIANRGNTTQALGLRLRVVKSTGSTSANYLTTSQGSVDGKDVVNLNNTQPSINIGTITYPATQEALKNTETATVANTVTSTGTVTYSYISPNGDLTISNPTTYETSKTVTRAGGTYNISTTNFTLTATRTENNYSNSSSAVVYIANTTPTLTVSNPAARLRSGGNDGTAVQQHIITITSSQQLISAPTLQVDGGTTADWQTSATFSGGPTVWTNTLLVDDDDAKGTFNWGAISGTGLSGLNQTSNSGSSQYTLGGFVARNLTVAAYGTTATFNTTVTDYSKISSTLNWSVKSLTNKRAVGTTATPDVGGWAINRENPSPITINILDTQAAGSSSQASTITGFQESV